MINKMNLTDLIEDTKSVVLRAVQRHLQPEFHYAVDDVVQETYIRVVKALQKKKFKNSTKLHGYIYTIARNEANRMNQYCIIELNKRQMLLEAESQTSESETSVLADLKMMLTQLPLIYQDVLRLSLQGYKIKEIGSMLGISTGTVKSRTSRAKDMLQRLYTQSEMN